MRSETLSDRGDALRLVGGVLFALGAIVLLYRRSTDWGTGARFVVLLIPCVLLYGMAFAATRAGSVLQPWQVVFFVFGLLLVPVVLLLFIRWIGGTPGDDLNLIWIFGLTAGLGVYASLRAGASYSLLLAALALIIVWISLWDKIVDLKPNGVRILLLVAAIAFVAAAVALRRRFPRQHVELVTAAGLAILFVGLLSVGLLFASRIPSLSGSRLLGQSAKPNEFWNILLLVVSLALIAYGARLGARGTGYIGAIGLLVFATIVGINIAARLKNEDPTNIVGWPLVLLVLGIAGLVLSFVLPGGGHRPDPMAGDGPGDGGGLARSPGETGAVVAGDPGPAGASPA